MKRIELVEPKDPEAFAHNFNKAIGSEHLGTVLYEPVLRHLQMARRDLGVQYLRCHGLLSGSPDVCSWANQSRAGLDPELGFGPSQLVGNGDILHNFAFIDLMGLDAERCAG